MHAPVLTAYKFNNINHHQQCRCRRCRRRRRVVSSYNNDNIFIPCRSDRTFKCSKNTKTG